MTPRALLIGVCGLLLSVAAWGADTESEPVFDEQRLDGVTVEAVETYVHPKNHDISISFGYYPFNSYYNGFMLNAGYTYYLSSNVAWEVVHGSYAFTTNKKLSNELAESFGVNPQSIERVEYMASTNLVYVPAYGKFVLFGSSIHYFRAGFLLGGGLVTTNRRSRFGVNVGLQFETYVNPSFSWRIGVRDLIALTGETDNFVSFTLGAGLYF